MLIGIITALSALSAVLICLGTESFAGYGWLWMLPAGFLGSFLALLFLFALTIFVMGIVVDMKKPQEKDSGFYRCPFLHKIGGYVTFLPPDTRNEHIASFESRLFYHACLFSLSVLIWKQFEYGIV